MGGIIIKILSLREILKRNYLKDRQVLMILI